jgi:hypothetical protein
MPLCINFRSGRLQFVKNGQNRWTLGCGEGEHFSIALGYDQLKSLFNCTTKDSADYPRNITITNRYRSKGKIRELFGTLYFNLLMLLALNDQLSVLGIGKLLKYEWCGQLLLLGLENKRFIFGKYRFHQYVARKSQIQYFPPQLWQLWLVTSKYYLLKDWKKSCTWNSQHT